MEDDLKKRKRRRPKKKKKGRRPQKKMEDEPINQNQPNTKDNPEQYIEYFRQETIMSATNLFNAAVNALKVQPTLSKVVSMKHIPRYDPSNVDPLSLNLHFEINYSMEFTCMVPQVPRHTHLAF